MFSRIPAPARLALAASAACFAATTTLHAFPVTFLGFDGSLDSTLSIGASFRLEERDRLLYGTTAGGLQNSVNTDDGNLNYARGLTSAVIKGTHDLQLRRDNLGVFVRGTWFYDHVNNDVSRRRTQLSDAARGKVGAGADILDAYVYVRFDLADIPFDVRAGSMVLSWGESTFIQNGINVINAVDVSRLRVPGSELREALKPVPMASISAEVLPGLSVDAFYLFQFSKTELDPAGSYFSTNDFASIGGRFVYLGFGSLADTTPFGAIPRAPANRKARDSGQYGFAVRYLAEGLGDTEFGAYFINHHSRLPLISAITPTSPINTNLTSPLTQVFVGTGLSPSAAAAQAAAIWSLITLQQTNPSALTPQQIATLTAPQTQAAINGARQIAFLTSAATGRYVIEYPEDIRLFGLSLNTSVGDTALQGEVSFRDNQPLQVDDVELLFAALSAINPTFGANNQLGNFLGQLGRDIPGYRRLDVWQAQATATHVFGPMLGASQLTLVTEAGVTYVPDLPQREVLRFDGSGTFTSGSAAAMANTGNGAFPATEADAFADDISYGLQLAARLDYADILWGINASPILALAYDIAGNTPLPLSNFVENRTTLTLGADLVYQNAWSLEARYVTYFNGGAYNLLADRDFASVTVKYSF